MSSLCLSSHFASFNSCHWIQLLVRSQHLGKSNSSTFKLSKTFRDHVCFQGLSRHSKSGKEILRISRIFKDPQEPWYLLIMGTQFAKPIVGWKTKVKSYSTTRKALLTQRGMCNSFCTVVWQWSIDFIHRSHLYGFWLQFQRKPSKTKSVARGHQTTGC